MKQTRLLFIDRDGTLIQEPEDEQIDSFEKLVFTKGVFRNLSFIAQHTDYELVMVSNQDGLGTDSFPEDTFWPVHNFIIQTLESEGIHFAKQHIDRHFPEDNSPMRKPGTGMLTEYIDNPAYDMANSYVIGDRETDAQLAENLGCKSLISQISALNRQQIAMNVIIGNQQGRTIKKLSTKAIASNGEICAHHSTPIDIFRAQLSLIEQEILGFICQFLTHEHTHQIIYVRLMLKLASEIESVRITFRFSMPSNSFIPMKHILTVSRRMITGADIESSAQPLASLRKREILPFHHQVDIITTPPACKAMASIG